VNASQFATGFFAAFDLEWLITAGRQPTNYGSSGVPFELRQDQEGGHVELWPDPNAFTLTHAGQQGTSTVYITIVNDKDGNPPPSVDGTDLVGNLKLDAGSAVGSVTNVQVHIRLVHPSSCLSVYTFVTDQEFTGILSTTNVKVGESGAKKDKVVSSNPGQFSDNVLIVNACGADQTFDLKVDPDPSFVINSNGNPVVAYTAAGEFDTSTFGALFGGTSTNHQQNLCLQNVTVPFGATLLVTVHSEVQKDALASTLPADSSFDFAAALFETVNGGCAGSLNSLAAPNAATFVLPFTINAN
jgi:hypothetical protein